jgi:TorA maturation chaperone TorD
LAADPTSPLDAAVARSGAYALLAKLLVRGLDDERLALVRSVPPLADSLGEEADLDELASQHHALFSLQLQPYGGVFLDGEGLAGGDVGRAVQDDFTAAGFIADLDGTSPDHLGLELAFLAFLSGAEADAVEDGKTEIVEQLRARMSAFLDEHVLTWLPALVVGLPAEEGGFWPDVVHMALELCAEHRAELDEEATEPPRLPAPPSLVDDEKTSLRGLARFFATPAFVGAVLTRSDLAKIGRRQELPHGFGGRKQMLESLLDNAKEYGDVPALFEALGERLAAVDDRWATLAGRPGLEGPVMAWRARLAATRALLGKLEELAQSAIAHAEAEGPKDPLAEAASRS